VQARSAGVDFGRSKGSFRLERSRAERSKDRNKVTAVTTKLQRSNALICFTYATQNVNEPLVFSNWSQSRTGLGIFDLNRIRSGRIIFIVGHAAGTINGNYIKTYANITIQHDEKERKTKNKIVA